MHDDDDDAFVRCSLLSCHVEPSTNCTGENSKNADADALFFSILCGWVWELKTSFNSHNKQRRGGILLDNLVYKS